MIDIHDLSSGWRQQFTPQHLARARLVNEVLLKVAATARERIAAIDDDAENKECTL
jgi:hypothetical protein